MSPATDRSGVLSLTGNLTRLDGCPDWKQRLYDPIVSPLMTCLNRFLVSDDIRHVDLTSVHNLSGPIAVEGAEPGDCLVIDILDGRTQRTGLSNTLT